MTKPLKIVIISSEVDPFSKTGGLADVAYSLPKALKRLGHKVIIITPLYGTIDRKKFKLEKIAQKVPVEINGDSDLKADFYKTNYIKGLPVYFVDNPKFFSKRKTIYSASNNGMRFLFFNFASLELLKEIKFSPDIIHCNDWQTGLIPYLIKVKHKDDFVFSKAATVFTIHNLSFQGSIDWWKISPSKSCDGRSPLPPLKNKKAIEKINFAKRGIIHADIINAVSQQYTEEILKSEFGQGLHKILQNRAKRKELFGILNGIDYSDYNPKTDPGLIKNYDIKSLDRKVKNKIFLQRKYKLPVCPNIPLLAIAARITEQKGINLLMEIMDSLLRLNLQMIFLGSADKHYEKFFKKLERKHHKKISTNFKFETKYVTRVYAGSDMFLMPSRFEPCGLGQLISLRYGSVPIVRATGGLLDTITDFNPKTYKGNGFVFKTYHSQDFLVAIVRALETYKYKDIWKKIIKNGMEQSFSWEIPAKKYVSLFRKAIRIHKE